MIISASRRTDLPAFYAEWFMRRVRAGYCTVVNPCNTRQVTRVSLCPDDVGAIVFWTRNARPLLPSLPELDARGHRYYFQYTLTGYPRVFEPGTPEPAEAVATMRRLAEAVGPARVIWRYDPILCTTFTPPAYHLEQFDRLAGALQGAVQRVVISLFDAYRGAGERLGRLAAQGIAMLPVSEGSEEFAGLLHGLATCARAHGLEIVSCAEPYDLRPYGIAVGRCIDAELLARLFDLASPVGKDPYQRAACGCAVSKDIGMYECCPHACLYCYATRHAARVAANRATHHPDAPSLLGWYEAP